LRRIKTLEREFTIMANLKTLEQRLIALEDEVFPDRAKADTPDTPGAPKPQAVKPVVTKSISVDSNTPKN
jgi:hypothetical protein